LAFGASQAGLTILYLITTLIIETLDAPSPVMGSNSFMLIRRSYAGKKIPLIFNYPWGLLQIAI
jgi:hypothetical protein